MLKETAYLFKGNTSFLPLWGAGIITHGIPKIKRCVIGITEKAKIAEKKDQTKDHLYRVTETARYIINEINTQNIDIDKVEKLLLERSALMITTRSENNHELKQSLSKCTNKDDWIELYKIAKIKYTLY